LIFKSDYLVFRGDYLFFYLNSRRVYQYVEPAKDKLGAYFDYKILKRKLNYTPL